MIFSISGDSALSAYSFFGTPAVDRVAVAYDHSQSAGLVKCLRILRSKLGKLADGGVFFEYDFAFTIGIDLQRVTFPDAHRAADLFRDDNTPQIIDPSYDSSCFHKSLHW